jgi:cation transport ATPase
VVTLEILKLLHIQLSRTVAPFFFAALAISIKIIFLSLAFAGMSNLVFAIAADVGVTLIVIMTSLQLMSYKE